VPILGKHEDAVNGPAGLGYVPDVHRSIALLLLLLGLGVVFLGAWVKDTGWTGWSVPVLIAGGLFVFGAGWAAMEIPHDHYRKLQPLDQGPSEEQPFLTASLLAVLLLGVLIAGAVWFARGDNFTAWFQ